MAEEEKELVLTVAQDGSGDFCTISAALEALKDREEGPVTLQIRNGIYRERLEITRPYLTLQGEDWEKTVIRYGLGARMIMEDGSKRGTFRSYSVFIDTHHLTAKDLTFGNDAGPGEKAGQAIALYADGDRLIFDHCRFLGSQDTLFTGPLPPKEIEKNGFVGPKQFAPRINGRHWYRRCYLRGDIDFIFGSATAYFEECEIFSQNIQKPVNGYVTAASTPEGQKYGYVFSRCHFTGDCPPETVYLGRPWRNYARVVLLECRLEAHIHRQGWHDWDKTDARETVLFAEYESTGPGAWPDERPSWVRMLNREELEEYSREMVLGTDF